MARKSAETTEDPTEDLVEESPPFTLEQLSDIVAHNAVRGLLHLPSHIGIADVPRADYSKE